ncbi:MAG: ACP S-malonyltransferase [Gemmatimonadetes bacterium]|nr:ACP S-malonyltransferase [Gemmatimonadota bacterium]
MGRDLAEAFAEGRATFQEADEVLGFGLSRLAWDGPEEELTATHNAQPAILVHSIAAYRIAAPRLERVDIRFAAGHSLGEFSAYVAAGAMRFGDALRTVRRRGELMLRSGRERPGSMAAILGLDDDAVERVCLEATTDGGDCVAANYNAPGQIVISGDVPAVERALVLARAAGARRAIRLNVSGAFHSPLMAVAKAGLAAHLDSLPLEHPRFPVVSNVNAQAITEPGTARELLVQQLTAPVRWTACMRTMLDAGVRSFFEFGPGSVLSGLLRRLERAAETHTLGTAAEVRELLAA